MRLIILAFAALLALPLRAQVVDFEATTSGLWSDSRIWEKNESGVWLAPVDNTYPGDATDHAVNVTVSEGKSVVVGKDQIVQINSLSVLGGKVTIEGVLVIGSMPNDPSPSTG